MGGFTVGGSFITVSVMDSMGGFTVGGSCITAPVMDSMGGFTVGGSFITVPVRSRFPDRKTRNQKRESDLLFPWEWTRPETDCIKI